MLLRHHLQSSRQTNGLGLECEAETGEPVRSEGRYRFEPEHGLSAQSPSASGADIYNGRELISLREERLDDEDSLRAAKRLLRSALRPYLGERPLSTSSVLKDVFERGLDT